MPITVTYPSDDQADWDAKREDHRLAMKRASDHETAQYQDYLRALQLYAPLKAACDTNQKTELGLAVYSVAAARWAEQKAKTAAILQGTADALGVTLADLLTEIGGLTLPTEFDDARTAIAQA